MEEARFRFSSRKEYEAAIVDVIHEKDADEKRYEDLVNEYLSFCSGDER